MARKSGTKSQQDRKARAKMATGRRGMTSAKDDAYDRKNKIAENGSKDKALDKRRGVK